MKKINWKYVFNGVLLAISFGILLYFCLIDNNFFNLVENFKCSNKLFLIFSFVCMFLNWLFDSFIIYTFFKKHDRKLCCKRDAFKVTMVGQFFNAISPLNLAGQPMQIVALSKKGIRSGNAISALIPKFLVYQTVTCLYSAISIVIRYNFLTARIPGLNLCVLVGFTSQIAVIVAIGLFFVNKRITNKIINFVINILAKIKIFKQPEKVREGILEQLELYTAAKDKLFKNKKLLIKIFALTVLQVGCLYSVPFFIYKAFNQPGGDFVGILFSQAFVVMTSSFVPLPGAAGATEGIFLQIFKTVFPAGLINSAMLLFRFITYYSCIIFGVFFIGQISQKKQNHNSLKQE